MDENAGIGYEEIVFTQSKVRRVMKVLAINDIQSSITLSNPRIKLQLKGAVATNKNTLED